MALLPIYTIIFLSFLNKPLLTSILVPFTFYFLKKFLTKKIFLGFDKVEIEPEIFVYSRNYIFQYIFTNQTSFPLWFFLVENTNSGPMYEYVYMLRKICGPHIYCRFSVNRILIISKINLSEQLLVNKIPFVPKEIVSLEEIEKQIYDLEYKLNYNRHLLLKQKEISLKNSIQLSTLGQIAAGLAHEIRNPLTSVKGFLQLYRAGNYLEQSIIHLMHDELNRINELVTDLLSLSVNAGSKEISHKFDINQLVIEIIELNYNEIQDNNIQLNLNLSPTLPLISIDKNRLKQVVLNLIKNALQVLPYAGSLTIVTHYNNSNIILQVIDNGPGIADEIFDKIFEPFFTTKPYGTGLGLTICNQIISEYGGQIRISRENDNTVVIITLPT